jgi:hypothetical protein
MTEPYSYYFDNPSGQYNFGLEKFYDTAVNPEIPGTDETFGSSPTLPKPLQGENDYLGKIWDADFHARIHENILGALTRQVRTQSREYEWSRVEFHAGEAKPAIYGETPEIITYSQSFFRGSLQGVIPTGIKIPRGLWEEGVESFNLWWNVQVDYLYDSLEIYAQNRIYYRILNTFDPLKFIVRKKKRPLADLTKYTNPCVNAFRKFKGWDRFYTFDTKMMNEYYPQRLTDGRNQSWVFLISPESNELAKFYKDEELLFLWSGNANRKYPNVKMSDYTLADNVEKYNKDAVFPIPNFFAFKDMPFGKNILCMNHEYPRYYRFKPWNMLNNKIKPDLDSYDIAIIDDRQQKKQSRIKFVNAVKAFDLEKLPQIFGLKNEENYNLHELIKKTIRVDVKNDDYEPNLLKNKNPRVLTEITEGRVKNPTDYYMYMLDMMDIDETVSQIKMSIRDKKEDIHKESYNKFLVKIEKLVEFLSEESTIDATTLNIFFTKIKIPDFFDVGKRINVTEFLPTYTSYEDLITKLESNIADYLLGVVDKDEYFIEIFEKIKLKNNGKNNDKNKVRKIVEKLLDMNIDPFFGVFLYKRQVYNSDSTAKVRKQSIEQLHMKLFANVYQEPNTGDINIGAWKSFGERLVYPRDIKVYKDTFVKKCVLGGGNKFFELKKNNRQRGPINVFKNGDIWVVPVTLNEVLAPRINMIDRIGFDKLADWDEVITELRLKDDDDGRNYYYSTYEEITKLYEWNRSRDNLRNEGDYYYNNSFYKENSKHWAGWQKYMFDKSEDPETGPFGDHHIWWEIQKPSINTTITKDSEFY